MKTMKKMKMKMMKKLKSTNQVKIITAGNLEELLIAFAI